MSSSSDRVPPPSSEKQAGALMVTLDGLVLAASSISPPGFGNLADENARKGATAFVSIEQGSQSAQFESLLGGNLTRNNTVVWKPRDHNWRVLDVSSPTPTLVVKLWGTDKNALFIPRFIGFTPTWSSTLKFSSKSVSLSRELVHFKAGGGTIYLRLCYSEQKVSSFIRHGSKWGLPQPIGCTDLFRVKRYLGGSIWDVDPSYVMKIIENVDGTPAKFEISHPFISPLQFSLTSPDDDSLRVLSPMATGGYLFSHLQKHRRFTAFLTKLFAAQLICVLECLHGHGISFACIRPEYITVDAFGHISLCWPDIFLLDPLKNDKVLPGKLEVSAPELLLGQAPSHTADWWSLGILLHEMLTGLLPLSHENLKQHGHTVTNKELHIEPPILPDAADILMRLLEKDPTKRLGVNGVSEIKAHAFFKEIDWNELLLRPSVARFEICDTNQAFKSSEGYSVRGNIQKHVRVSGITYMEQTFDVHKWWIVTGRVRDKVSSEIAERHEAQQNNNEYEVKWDEGSHEFYLHNNFTDEKRQVNEHTTNQIRRSPIRITKTDAAVGTDTSTGTGTGATSARMSSIPSELQKRYALRTALEFGCSNGDIERILEFSPTVSLDFGVLGYDYAVDASVSLRAIDGQGVWSQDPIEVMLTPLEWAVEHDNIDLVNLFLRKGGADASYTAEVKHGPALLKAVDKGDARLVEILVTETNRLSATRALSKAVALSDRAMVEALLKAGVRCDFERADGAAVDYSPTSDISVGPQSLGVSDYINPLAIAARAGDEDLVRLLLERGADANAEYHELERWEVHHEDGLETVLVAFRCGRPVEVAMELGHSEVVRVLLEGGADIWAPRPVSWFIGHTCDVVPRDVYVRVTAELAYIKVD